jgi:hypothetical protein
VSLNVSRCLSLSLFGPFRSPAHRATFLCMKNPTQPKAPSAIRTFPHRALCPILFPFAWRPMSHKIRLFSRPVGFFDALTSPDTSSQPVVTPLVSSPRQKHPTENFLAMVGFCGTFRVQNVRRMSAASDRTKLRFDCQRPGRRLHVLPPARAVTQASRVPLQSHSPRPAIDTFFADTESTVHHFASMILS